MGGWAEAGVRRPWPRKLGAAGAIDARGARRDALPEPPQGPWCHLPASRTERESTPDVCVAALQQLWATATDEELRVKRFLESCSPLSAYLSPCWLWDPSNLPPQRPCPPVPKPHSSVGVHTFHCSVLTPRSKAFCISHDSCEDQARHTGAYALSVINSFNPRHSKERVGPSSSSLQMRKLRHRSTENLDRVIQFSR